MFDVNSILAKTDLADLVEKAGGKLRKAGSELRCACPIHGGHDATGFAVYHKDGKDLFQCFSGDCGGGDAITFVQAWRGWDFKKACEFLGGDTQSDPVEMMRLADERAARAAAELADKQARMEAALRELQAAERHLYYHEHAGQWAKDMWAARGLPEEYQGYWYLGGCDDFVIGEGYHTPTLTIPIFDEGRNVLNIKHRLVNPQKPTDKYRPERGGLGPFPPLLACPEMGYDGGTIIVVEGEIKAMVTWAYAGISDWQVIGVPGRTQFKSVADKLKGKNVLVIPDPGAEKEAIDLARAVGGKFLKLPDKVDDFILSAGLGKDEIYRLTKQARRV